MPTLDEAIAQAQWYADNDEYLIIVSTLTNSIFIGVANTDEMTVVDGAILEVTA